MFLYKMGKAEIGSWDVKARKAVLLGDGEGKIALTAMAESVSPSRSPPYL
jgi:hypothetical protein